jgi:hypothetical protein
LLHQAKKVNLSPAFHDLTISNSVDADTREHHIFPVDGLPTNGPAPAHLALYRVIVARRRMGFAMYNHVCVHFVVLDKRA